MEPGLEKVLIPPFTLQPLIENASKHAFSRFKNKGEILIVIIIENDHMHISVEDNGNGIPEEKIKLLGKQMYSQKMGRVQHYSILVSV